MFRWRGQPVPVPAPPPAKAGSQADAVDRPWGGQRRRGRRLHHRACAPRRGSAIPATRPTAKPCAGGNGGIGSRFLSASSRAAMKVSTCSGVATGMARRASRRGRRQVDAGLPRVDGEARRKSRHERRRNAEDALQLADAFERRIGRHVFRACRLIVRRLGAVGPAQIVGIAPVEIASSVRCAVSASSPPTFCSSPLSSGSAAELTSMRALSS